MVMPSRRTPGLDGDGRHCDVGRDTVAAGKADAVVPNVQLPRRPSGDDAELIALMADEVSMQLLSNLPDDERRAIQAHVLEGVEYPEIAAATVISEPAARMRVSRGLTRMRARMGSRR